jgi:hypothetical protein
MKTNWKTNKSEIGKKITKRVVHLLNISGDLTNRKQLLIHLMVNSYEILIQLLITMEKIT